MKKPSLTALRRRSLPVGALMFASLVSLVSADDPVPAGAADNPINTRIENGAMIIDVDGNGVVEVAPSPGGPWVPLNEALPGVRLQAPIPLDAARRFIRQRRPDGNVGIVRPVIPDLPPEPPRFSSVVARGFDGTKVSVEAVLAPGQVVPQILPFFIGNEMVLLRDDGLEGDTTARDGRFHGVLPVKLEDMERARGIMDSFSSTAALQDFAGREVKLEPVAAVDVVGGFDDFLAGRPVPLPLPILLPPPPPGPNPPPVILPPPPPGVTPITPCNQLPTWQKTLLITDLSVVEDPARTFDPSTGAGTPMGAWTFGRLMTDLANPAMTGINPSDFARRWLRTWEADQSINNDPVPNRKAKMVATILRSWEAASGGPGSPLRMDVAPFRLLAIVNRLDLRGNVTYGGGISDDCCEQRCLTGEGRFVFMFSGDHIDQGGGYPDQGGNGGLIGGDPRGAPAKPFLVVFEYCIPREGCPALKAYAQAWADLQCLPWGPVYNSALQRITDVFATANAMPAKPNGSALNQLRTNENLLTPPTAVPPTQWELREFKLFCNDSDKGFLRPVTVKQTPREDSDGTRLLQHYIKNTLPAPPDHAVPLEWGIPGFQMEPFLGGRAVMPPISITSGSAAWATTGATVNNMLRHDFALHTCNGCHSTETDTRFMHVGARGPGQQAPLSGFLIGDGAGGPLLVNIPGSPAATVRFFDLRRRERDLVRFLLTPCGLTVVEPRALEAAAVH
jgi:hypothetical protein